jgi:hypothetical protein
MSTKREVCGTYVVAIRILDQSKSIVRDLIDELNTLGLRGVVDAALKDTAAMAVGGYLNTVSGNGVVDELDDRSEAGHRGQSTWSHTWLSSGTSLFKHFWMTWLPFKSLMSTTT